MNNLDHFVEVATGAISIARDLGNDWVIMENLPGYELSNKEFKRGIRKIMKRAKAPYMCVELTKVALEEDDSAVLFTELYA